MNSSEQLMCYFRDGESDFSQNISTDSYNDGIWHQVVCVREGTTTKLYVDGALISTNTNPLLGNINVVDGDAPHVGVYSPTLIQQFDGQIDDIFAWKTTVTDSEVQKLYESQNSDLTELSSTWTPKWASIVGYWKMDGNWQDSSGNGNHGGVQNEADFSIGSKIGSHTGTFDGVNDHTNITHSPDFEFTSFSVCAWIKKTGTTYGRFFSKQSSWILGVANDGQNQNLFWVHDKTVGGTVVTGVRVEQNQWYHACMVRDTTNDVLNIYLNSILIDSASSVDNTAELTAVTISIGARDTAAQPWPGQIDDAAIWQAALSSGEVSLIYHRQKQEYAGSYDSEVVDLGSVTSNWPDLSWSTSLPFGKELVGDFNGDGSPDGDSSSDYTSLQGSLANGLMGYWKFQNKDYDGTLNEVLDFSGNVYHGTFDAEGGEEIVSGSIGPGVSIGTESVSVPVASAPSTSDTITLSFWFNAVTNLNNTFNVIFKNRDSVGFRGWQVDSSATANQLRARIDTDAGVNQTFIEATSSGGALLDGQWHMLTLILDQGSGAFFVDGKASSTFSYSHGSGFDRGGAVGDFTVAGPALYNGRKIDEVSLWHRQLSVVEIQELYRRSANRIKFQVKSCIDVNCECKSLNTYPVGTVTDCDGDTILNAIDFDDIHKAEFIGPGGDGTTYYSEHFNRGATNLTFNCGTNTTDNDSNICVNDEITLGAGPRPTSPVVDYSDFPLKAKPGVNPYFQYRVYMEADSNTACDGSPCLPELTSVNLNPEGSDKFYGALQEITANKPISYSTINSLTVTADDCATFQLSPNSTDFYYWSTSSWVLATAAGHRSSKDDLETNIVSFATQFGPGLLYVKSFLETNASQTQNCSIQSIDINYTRE